jgi:hypothetical protein
MAAPKRGLSGSMSKVAVMAFNNTGARRYPGLVTCS